MVFGGPPLPGRIESQPHALCIAFLPFPSSFLRLLTALPGITSRICIQNFVSGSVSGGTQLLQVELCFPKRRVEALTFPPRPVHVTSFGNRIFLIEIKLGGGLPGLEWALIHYDWRPYKKIHRQAQGEGHVKVEAGIGWEM